MTMQTRLLTLLMLASLVAGCSTLPMEESSEVIEPEQAADSVAVIEQQQVPRPRFNSKAEQLFEMANGLRTKNTPKALALYQSAITADPAMEPAYYNLARLNYEQNSYAEIEPIRALAEQHTIQSARLSNVFGSALRQQGQFQKAKDLYLKALGLNANYQPSLVNLAILSDIYLQDLVTAQEYYLKYQATLSEDSPEARKVKNWLADLNLRLKKSSGGE